MFIQTLQCAQAVLVKSESVPKGTPQIRGYDFCDGRSLDGLMDAMLYSGFQASALGKAIEEVKRMVSN